MAARALLRDAEMRRAAKIARQENVPIMVELPDGTKFHFGRPSEGRAANPLDDIFE